MTEAECDWTDQYHWEKVVTEKAKSDNLLNAVMNRNTK
jgi:hypothetical protein